MATMGSKVVLFGGDQFQNDTWTFDGTTWTHVTTSVTPPGRSTATMATLGTKVVLFGGYNIGSDGGVQTLGDTWLFDGATWSNVNAPASPPARWLAGMAGLGSEVILFGGQDSSQNPLGDTWAFDGSTWTAVGQGSSPSGRASLSMAFLP
jgi:hypothetical protein